MDIEKFRDDIRTQKVETAAAHSRIKGQQQELELLRERESAQRAALRLSNLGGVHTQAKPAAVGLSIPGDKDRLSYNKGDKDHRRGSSSSISGYLESGDDDDYCTNKKGNHRRASDSSSQYSQIMMTEKEIKDIHPRHSPLLSSTPPRRPHYTLPSTTAPTSPSQAGVASDRMHFKDRNSYDSVLRSSVDVASGPLCYTRSSLVLEAGSEVGRRLPESCPPHKQPSTGTSRDNAGRALDLRQEKKEGQRLSNLRPPTLSDASQHFSDSELLHYNKHSTRKQSNSSSRNDRESLKETHRGKEVSGHHDDAVRDLDLPRRLSLNNRRPVDTDCSNSVGLESAISSEKRPDKNRPPNNKISFNEGSSAFRESTNTMSRSGNNPLPVSPESSVMQRRAEKILDRGDSSSPPNLEGQVSVPSDADAARFDRLQNMYERFTGKGAPTVWRDSDSSESD